MADPICRWRNTTPDTVKELVRLLPKSSMNEAEFKGVVKKNCEKYGFSYDGFFSTAYQLAVQIGLYFIDDNDVFHPRFDHDLEDDEAREYVFKVARQYIAPNPYARSMQTSSDPIALYDYFVQCAGKIPKNASIDVKDALSDYYKVPIGNVDMIVNLLARTGSFEKVDGRHIKYVGYVGVAEDKEKYFKHFGVVLHDEKKVEQISKVDCLVVALKLFQRQRAGGGWLGGESLAEAMRREFVDWCVKVDGKAKATPLTYLPPLVSVSKPLEVKSMKSSWNGVYEFIFEKKPAKHVLEITSAAELDVVYGDLLKVYDVNDLPMPEGANAANWNKVRAWVKADKVKGASAVIIHASAFAKYRQFLVWREANSGAAKGGPNGWASYDAWAKAARETFAKVDAGMLVAADFDYAEFARKFVYNPTVANAFFKDHKEDEKREVGNFISQNRQSPKAASWYLDKGNLPAVKGLGVGCVLNFMMKVRPAEFATYSPMIDKSLMSVGLLAKPLPTDPTVESYEQSKALQGQVLAKMHELHIGKAADDESAADYLTVNEFAWWLSDEKNQNLIEKKILEGQKMKTAKHEDIPTEQKAKKPKVNLADADDVLLLRLRAALKTKPFAILAGHSGTGKSRMVRKLAYMTCAENDLRVDENGNERKEPGNFCMVQVKPNWHDSSDLLGYYSELGKRYRATDFVKFICKAYAYPKVPFFVCLDEMNLAPVEQYFAEYLSAIESRKLSDDKTTQTTDELLPRSAYTLGDDEERVVHYDWLGCEYDAAKAWIEKNGLTIPRNLFVVGTVNMDESTNQFSRKVLDRAMTIEMTDADFDSFGQKGAMLSFEDYMGDAAVADLLAGEVQATELTDDQKGMLNALKEVLKTTSFAVAYRFANEYALYEAALGSTLDPKKNEITKIKDGLSDDEKAKLPAQPVAFDDMVLMKVLPRISGDEAEVKKLFYGEGGKLSDPKDNTLVKLLGPSNDTGSVRKIKLILERGGSYLSFWP